MIAEYRQISMRKSQTVFKVIRGEDSRSHGESSFRAEEGGCHVCGVPGHFYRNCKFFNKKYSLPKTLRHLRVGVVVAQIFLYPEVATRGEQGDPTDQAGPTVVDRILPTHTQRKVVSSHA